MQILFVLLCLAVDVLSTSPEKAVPPPAFQPGLPGFYLADVNASQFYNPLKNLSYPIPNLALDISTSTGSQAAASSLDRIFFTGGAPNLKDVRILALDPHNNTYRTRVRHLPP